jgi:hypothetical protein
VLAGLSAHPARHGGGGDQRLGTAAAADSHRRKDYASPPRSGMFTVAHRCPIARRHSLEPAFKRQNWRSRRRRAP